MSDHDQQPDQQPDVTAEPDLAAEMAAEMIGVAEDPTSPAGDETVDGTRPTHAPDTADDGPEAAGEEAIDWPARAAADPRSPGELLAELVEAESRRDEYLEDVRRARAEFENYRKRTMKESAAQRDQGRAEVAGRLLDVLDDFDRTLTAAEKSSDEGLAKGVELVYGKLVTVLRDLGLTRIDGTEVVFDPNRHEAVQQLPSEEPVEEPVVAEVFRPGYELGGKVLRPAMVVVRQ